MQQADSRKTYFLFSSFFGWNASAGGATLSADVVRQWLERGHRVHVAASMRESYHLPGLEQFLSDGSLVIHPVISAQSTRYGHLLNGEVGGKVRKLLSELRPDFIHIHNFQGLLSGVLAAVESGITTVYTALDFGLACITWYLYDGTLEPCSGPAEKKCHACVLRTQRMRVFDAPYHFSGLIKRAIGTGDNSGLKNFFDPRLQHYWRHAPENIGVMTHLYQKFDHIIAPSPPTYDLIVHYRKSSSNVHQLLYPVSPLRLRPVLTEVLPDTRPLKLLYLGHAHAIKGWPFFLQVLESIEDGLALEVYDGGGSESLFRRASMRVRRYLKSSYRCESSKIAQTIQEADATLVPSLWHENTPLVVLETLGNGRPVVAADQKGISNIIQNGRNGLLFKPGDLQAWVDGIKEMAKDPARLRKMRGECRYTRSAKDFVDDLEKFE